MERITRDIPWIQEKLVKFDRIFFSQWIQRNLKFFFEEVNLFVLENRDDDEWNTSFQIKRNKKKKIFELIP